MSREMNYSYLWNPFSQTCAKINWVFLLKWGCFTCGAVSLSNETSRAETTHSPTVAWIAGRVATWTAPRWTQRTWGVRPRAPGPQQGQGRVGTSGRTRVPGLRYRPAPGPHPCHAPHFSSVNEPADQMVA